MKAKLIFSPRIYGTTHPLMPPLGISILANHLRTNGHKADLDDLDVKLYRKKEIDLKMFDDIQRMNDYLFHNRPDDEIEEAGEKMLKISPVKDADAVGFSIVDPIGYCTSSTTLLLAKMIKERHDIPTIVGGLFDKTNADFFNKTPFIDYSITGYGEEGFRKLLDHLESGAGNLNSIPGLLTTKDKKEIYNPLQSNTCKFPDFKGLDLDQYKFSIDEYTQGEFLGDDILTLPYYFMNGCPNDCAFCGQSITGLPFEVKKPKIIAEELAILSQKHKTSHFCFLNTTLNLSKKFVHDISREIAEQDLELTWTDSANFRHLDKESIHDLRKSGLVRPLFGLESGSQKIIDFIGKGLDVSRLPALLKTCHDETMWNEVYLIAGLPHETEQDVQATVDFVNTNAPYLNFFHLNRFRLIDSAMTENPEKFGLKNISFIGDKQTNYSEYYTNRFDEIDGLKWEDKVKQIDSSFDSVSKAINHASMFNNQKFSSSHLQLIFSLFAQNDNMKDIEEAYSHIQASRVKKR